MLMKKFPVEMPCIKFCMIGPSGPSNESLLQEHRGLLVQQLNENV